MANKNYTVYFAKIQIDKHKSKKFSEALSAANLAHGANFPARQIPGYGNDFYQIRDLKLIGTTFTGVFGKLRHDAPHIVNSQDQESQLKLGNGDRLLEKCHFVYKSNHNALVWQVNRDAASLNRFSLYLSDVFQARIRANIVMNDAEIQKILSSDLYEISFTYARPDKISPGGPLWKQSAFNLMKDSGAALGKFLLRAERNTSLPQKTKNIVKAILGISDIEKIRVRLTDDSEPINLFTSPVKDKISVKSDGRYPVVSDLFQQLDVSYTRHKDSIPNRD